MRIIAAILTAFSLIVAIAMINHRSSMSHSTSVNSKDEHDGERSFAQHSTEYNQKVQNGTVSSQPEPSGAVSDLAPIPNESVPQASQENVEMITVATASALQESSPKAESHRALAEKAVLRETFSKRWLKATPVRDKTFFNDKLAGTFEGPVQMTNGKRSYILSIETDGSGDGETFDGNFTLKTQKTDGTVLGESSLKGQISQNFREDSSSKILLDVSNSTGRFYYEFDLVSREQMQGFVWRKNPDGTTVAHGTFILKRKDQ